MLSSCHSVPAINTTIKAIGRFIQYMQGNEIIERLKKVKALVWNVELKEANKEIDYIIDDIYMYRNNSL